MKSIRLILKVVAWIIIVGGPVFQVGLAVAGASMDRPGELQAEWLLTAIGLGRTAIADIGYGGALLLLISIEEKFSQTYVQKNLEG